MLATGVTSDLVSKIHDFEVKADVFLTDAPRVCYHAYRDLVYSVDTDSEIPQCNSCGGIYEILTDLAMLALSL